MSYVQVFQLTFSLNFKPKKVIFDHYFVCEVRRFLQRKKKVKDKQEITKKCVLSWPCTDIGPLFVHCNSSVLHGCRACLHNKHQARRDRVIHLHWAVCFRLSSLGSQVAYCESMSGLGLILFSQDSCDQHTGPHNLDSSHQKLCMMHRRSIHLV